MLTVSCRLLVPCHTPQLCSQLCSQLWVYQDWERCDLLHCLSTTITILARYSSRSQTISTLSQSITICIDILQNHYNTYNSIFAGNASWIKFCRQVPQYQWCTCLQSNDLDCDRILANQEEQQEVMMTPQRREVSAGKWWSRDEAGVPWEECDPGGGDIVTQTF